MKKSAYPIIAVLAIAAIVMLSGCGRDDDDKVAQPPYGKKTYATVQFRRDVLGSHMELPISPDIGSVNGAMVSISGKLALVNKEWVVLQQGKQQIWIPRDNVLLIKIN